MPRLAAAFLLAALAAGPVHAQAVPTPAPVWVNLKSGVYHCPGTEHYGATSDGEFLPEATAIAKGYSPNGGRRCNESPASPLLDDPGAPRSVPTLLPDAGPAVPRTGLSDCIVLVLKDGDTIQCKVQGPVRLIGIDTPERDQVPFGTAATAGMAALLPVGATVQLSLDKELRDRYGRLLAYVWYRGASVNWLMIRQGWAVSLRYPPNTKYAALFDTAESRAHTEQRGLWRVDGFSCRPKDHRDRKCQ
jgi:endonuclease YncB( thermonuclease family)